MSDIAELKTELSQYMRVVNTYLAQQEQRNNQAKEAKRLAKEAERAEEARRKIESKYEDERHRSGVKLLKLKKKDADGMIQYNNVFGKFYDKLTSHDEQVTLFGQHAGTVRKVMYGFLPPGMFRLVNKFTTVLRFLDINMRKVKKSSKEGKDELGFLGKAFNKIGKMTSIKKFAELGATAKDLKAKAQENFAQSRSYNDPMANTSNPSSSSYRRPDFRQVFGNNFMKRAGEAKKQRRQELGHMLTAGVFRKATMAANKKARAQRYADTKKMLKSFDFFKMIKMVGTVFLRTALFMTQMAFLAILTIGGLFVLFKQFGPHIMEIIKTVWYVISTGLTMVWEGISLIWEGAMAVFNGFFGDGDFGTAMSGLVDMLFGIGKVVLGLAISLIGPLLTILGGLFVEFIKWGWGKIETAWENFLKADWKERLGMIIKVLIMGFVITKLIAMAIAGFPILMALAIGVIIWKAVTWLIDKIPGFASGGVSSGGLAVVGEKGPELVNLPKGARVHSNKDSRNMASGGTVNHFNITVNAKDTSDAEMKRIADKVGKIVFNEVGRRTSFF